jgi:hypothetical protein
MPIRLRRSILVLSLFCFPVSSYADVMVRWDQDHIPSRDSLGLSAVLVPATNTAVIEHALAQGYSVYLELEAAGLAGFKPASDRLAGIVVKGAASASDLSQLKQRLGSAGMRVLALEERGKWPHIRTNWVTKRNEVLQVSRSSSQPWIEQNAALVRITQAAKPGSTPLLTYPWKPITLSDVDEGPRLEDYLVAIADAGSFGADLVLPLHERFQKNLLLGKPQARQWWTEIRRYIEFYSWNLPNRYRPLANIGVVTTDPMASFEVMNLLARHNLPFEIVAPDRLAASALAPFNVVIVLNQPQGPQLDIISEFAKKGGTVMFAGVKGTFPWQSGTPVEKTDDQASYTVGEGRVVERPNAANPDAFALEVRRMLGRERRVIDVWNGITVLAVPYQEPDGRSVLVTALNYAYQPLPVQMRVRGTFSVVQYESPEEGPVLLPYRHNGGYTEFLLEALRIGGRVFLGQEKQ